MAAAGNAHRFARLGLPHQMWEIVFRFSDRGLSHGNPPDGCLSGPIGEAVRGWQLHVRQLSGLGSAAPAKPARVDTQFAHAPAQGVGIDAQQPRGAEGAFDAPQALAEDGFDVAAGDAVEGVVP